MLSSPFPSPTALVAATRRLVVAVVLIAVGYITALVAWPSSDIRFDLGIGRAAAAKHASPEAVPAGGAWSTTADGLQRDFDYFPDHYSNQAREVAEQPPTF